MASNYYGILSPLDPRYVAPKVDPRIAATWYEYTLYMCRLAKQRPELIDRFFIDEERLTMH
jgi:hypothetical protein